MFKESFEKSDGGISHEQKTALAADFTSNNNVQLFRTVDQSLNFSSDNKYLVFDTRCIYPEPALPTSPEFDKLNTHHSSDGEESLSRREITKGAFDLVVASNTNGNNKVDLNEWLNVAPMLGYDRQEAISAYGEGVREANEGKSLYQITKDLITPKIMDAADTDDDGRIDRYEFDNWVTEIVNHRHRPCHPEIPNFPPSYGPPEPPDSPEPSVPPIDIPPVTVPPIDMPVQPPVQIPIEPPTTPTLPTNPPPETPPVTNPNPSPNKGTDLSSLITAGDSGVTSNELQHARDIANAMPEEMKKTLLANRIRLSVQSGYRSGEAQGQNSGMDGMFYADSGMADQSEVHELYEMYGQLTSGGAGSWSDSKAVTLADNGMRAAGPSVYHEGDLNDTIGNLTGDGDHLSNAFTADFFATHPELYKDRYGQDTLALVAQDDPNLTAYIAQATGLSQA